MSRQTLTPEQFAILRLIRGNGIGPVTFYKLVDHFGSAVRAAQAAEQGEVKTKPADSKTIEGELTAMAKLGAHFVFYTDLHYPQQLKMLPDAPPVLSALGHVALMQQKQVGLVGARNASAHGCRFTEKLAADLSAKGWCVTSGLARGVDTAAHKGGLSGMGKTIAVLGGGLDHIYPPENENLFYEIAKNGLILAESPLGTRPTAQSFPKRNRIVSGLCAGIVVVEAARKSGSLITAQQAGEQGREVMAVPSHPSDPRSHGANHLIRQGATLVTSADDILEAVSHFAFDAPTAYAPKLFTREEVFAPETADLFETSPMPEAEAAGTLEAKIIEVLSQIPTPIDDVVQAVDAPTAEVTAALSEMEMDGVVQRTVGGLVALKA